MSISRGIGRGNRPMSFTKCVECDHPMRPARVKVAASPGTRQHVGHGRCSRCYSTYSRYALPREAWERMLVAQRGLCAACSRQMVGIREPMVDHDHEAGTVRGLLCVGCNVAEGMLGGDPERARALAAYMERHARAGT